MNKTNIYEYYAFGHNYRLLNAPEVKNWSNREAKDFLNRFFTEIKKLQLPVTEKISDDLRALVMSLPRNEEKISTKSFGDIKVQLKKLDPALDAELKLKDAYYLTEKRFPLKTLTENPQKILGSGVYENLADTSQRDLASGCLLIAYSQPTGAAFHLMRALEAEVKHLYFEYKKTKRLERPMWANMIQQLRQKRNPKPENKTLDLLDGIRVHFRNPTQHPEAFYTLDEAQDLLNQTATAINMIHSEIKKKSS